MQQFDLSLWLQDKSRKVVTRDGRSVRIICTDGPNEHYQIVGFIENEIATFSWNTSGKHFNGNDNTILDLFFADEVEELSEFEKKLVEILKSEGAPIGNIEKFTDKDKEAFHCYSKQLLDLAKKEILKDLPKWKKATEHKDLEKHIAILEDSKVLLSDYLEEGDYYIDLEDLKTLPKEEQTMTDKELIKQEIERWIKEKHFIFTEIDEIIETAHHFVEWQRKKDQETIELAEDHAMLAGMEKMREEMMKNGGRHGRIKFILGKRLKDENYHHRGGTTMSKIAETKALEAYPEHRVTRYGPLYTYDGTDTPSEYDENIVTRKAFIEGYNQAMQDFLEKACEWLSKNARNYFSAYATSDKLIEDFKQYMEEEQ